MSVRRTSLPLLLSVLLVLVQQGAVLHELGHLSGGGQHAGVALRAQAQGSGAAQCLSCEAFAQVANPASGAAVSTAADPATFIPIAGPDHAVASADSPTPRSRGPPSV
jgi:hypothetical protein